jgi:hypothetical protein
MKYLRNLLSVVISILALSSVCFAGNEALDTDESVIMVYQAERKGSFLSEPGNVPIEFLRRVGRALNKTWPIDLANISAASIFEYNKVGKPDFLKPRKLAELNKEQKKTANELLGRYSSDAEELLQEIKPGEKCILMRAAAETEPLVEIFKEISDGKKFPGVIKQDQVYKVKNQLIPLLESSDYIICAAVLSEDGFEARLRIKSLDGKLANPAINHSLTIGKMINPDSLMAFAQTHPIENPAEVMAELMQMPQTESIKNMIASAGMDMEKDLIANGARESILYFNFEPTGEGGIPDVRFIAPIPDVKKLRSNLENLKQLCMQLGIFVKPIEQKFPLVRLSYFLFPQYGVYAGLIDEFLALATSDENLVKEMEFIKAVKSGKAEGEKIDDNLQRYWRVSFEDFNLQLQKFLQSPLMVSKGVPPITNLTMLDDLNDLKILTRLQPSSLDFSVFLPVKESKKTK